MAGFSRFASRKATPAPSVVQPPNSDLGGQTNDEASAPPTEGERERGVDGSKSKDWSAEGTAGFDDSNFLSGTKAASANVSIFPGLDTFDTMPDMEVQEFIPGPSLDLCTPTAKAHVEVHTSGRDEGVEGGSSARMEELCSQPKTPIVTEAEEKERFLGEGFFDSMAMTEVSATAQVLPTAKDKQVDTSKSRSAGIIGREAAPNKSFSHLVAANGSTGKSRVAFAFLPRKKNTAIVSSTGHHFMSSTNQDGQEKRNNKARMLDKGDGSGIFGKSQKIPAQRSTSHLETAKQTCERTNAFGHVSDYDSGPNVSKSFGLVNPENSIILQQVFPMPNKISTATSDPGSSSDTSHNRSSSNPVVIQENKKRLHEDGSMNEKRPTWETVASHADREELAKTPAARKPKELQNEVTPDSAPLNVSEIHTSSCPSFEEMYAKFQFDLRELSDTNHRNETALLGMEVALATTYNDTLYEHADLLQTLERSYDVLQELGTIIEDITQVSWEAT